MGKRHGRKLTRFLYYALGGGLGHVTRSVALARQLAKRGGEHVLVCNTPFDTQLEQIARVESSIRFERLPVEFPAAQVESRIRSIVHALCPEVLIVDTFPRGLGGELVSILTSTNFRLRVFINRGLPQAYIDSYQLKHFVAANYELTLLPGESSGDWAYRAMQTESNSKPTIDATSRPLPKTVSVNPFLVRDWDELPSRAAAAELLGVKPSSAAVLVVGCGNEDECHEVLRFFQNLLEMRKPNDPELRIALARPELMKMAVDGRNDNDWVHRQKPVTHWPLLECMPADDNMIGSAGYNLAWETKSLGIESLLVDRARKYDTQSFRATYSGQLDVRQVIKNLATVSRLGPVDPYINGASESAELICETLCR